MVQQQSCEKHSFQLDYGQFVDLSNMSYDKRIELFPVLNSKEWRELGDRFYILFRYPYGYYDDDLDEDEDYYDAFGYHLDNRDRWIKNLKEEGVTQQVFIDNIGSL